LLNSVNSEDLDEVGEGQDYVALNAKALNLISVLNNAVRSVHADHKSRLKRFWMRWGLFTASERNRDRGVQASVQADMSDEERKASDVERECSDSAEEPFNHFGNDEGGGIRTRIPKFFHCSI
jgi:hypothetical protein